MQEDEEPTGPLEPTGAYNGNTTWPHIGSVKAGPRSSFVEFHHLLTLLKEPQEGSDSTHIQGMCSQEHAVVEDASELTKHG